MKTLIQKDLVYEHGRPLRKYLLSEEGWDEPSSSPGMHSHLGSPSPTSVHMDQIVMLVHTAWPAPPDPTKFYTAWNSMKTLIQKDLVYEHGRPLRIIPWDAFSSWVPKPNISAYGPDRNVGTYGLAFRGQCRNRLKKVRWIYYTLAPGYRRSTRSNRWKENMGHLDQLSLRHPLGCILILGPQAQHQCIWTRS
jgi:hypothetical protein